MHVFLVSLFSNITIGRLFNALVIVHVAAPSIDVNNIAFPLRLIFSVYTPGATSTVSPFTLAFIPACMVEYCEGTWRTVAAANKGRVIAVNTVKITRRFIAGLHWWNLKTNSIISS
jgi:cytochrome c biogenesis protein CcdA